MSYISFAQALVIAFGSMACALIVCALFWSYVSLCKRIAQIHEKLFPEKWRDGQRIPDEEEEK